MIVLGIDPGLSGALSFINTETGVVDVHDMPVVEMIRNGKKKREVSAHLLADVISGFPSRITCAYVERVNAMTGQGVTSVFSFGRSAGILEGALAALGVPYTLVTPQAWQKSVALRGGKDGSRERAMQQFPDQSALFARKKDDGRADATLIALHGIKELHK